MRGNERERLEKKLAESVNSVNTKRFENIAFNLKKLLKPDLVSASF